VAELGDVMLSLIMKMNAPTAVGSSALLDISIVESTAIIFELSPQSLNNNC
jgi:hypothetical protein